MTLTDFLLARIAEDERTALFVDGRASSRSRTPAKATWVGDPFDSVALPARRMLAECASKRAVVRQLEAAQVTLDSEPLSQQVRSDVTPAHAYFMATREAVRALARAYADHPDYRDEWRP